MNLPFDTNFYGVPIAQTWVQAFFHLDAVIKNNVKLFVEVGAFKGGMTTLLLPHMHLYGLSYLGIEILNDVIDEKVRALPGCAFIHADSLDPDTIELVKRRIKECTAGTALVFCDGGNKPEELKAYSEIIRIGDLISVHDYSPEDGETNDENIGWIFNHPNFVGVDLEQRLIPGGLPMWRKK